MFGYVLIGTIAGVVCIPVSYVFVQPLLLSLLRCNSFVSALTVLVPVCPASRHCPESGQPCERLMQEPSEMDPFGTLTDTVANLPT
jgi:hypothetical protein